MGTQQTQTGDDCCAVSGYMRSCMHDLPLECCLLCSSERPYTQCPAGVAFFTHRLTSLTRLGCTSSPHADVGRLPPLRFRTWFMSNSPLKALCTGAGAAPCS